MARYTFKSSEDGIARFQDILGRVGTSLDTLEELADAIDNDPEFLSKLKEELDNKYELSESGIPVKDLSSDVTDLLDVGSISNEEIDNIINGN